MGASAALLPPALSSLGGRRGRSLRRNTAVSSWVPIPPSSRETHRRGQPLQSEACNAKNAPESAICRVRRKRPTTTGSVLWLVPISTPRSVLHRVRRANLPSDALPFRIPHSAFHQRAERVFVRGDLDDAVSRQPEFAGDFLDGPARLIDRHRLEVRIGGVGEGHGNWVASSS